MASVFSRLIFAPTSSVAPPLPPRRDQTIMHQPYPPTFHYPEFSRAPPASGELPEIPAIDTFWPEPHLMPSDDSFPTPAQCAAHLELLECFHSLKEKVMSSEHIDYALRPHSHATAGAAGKGGCHQMSIRGQQEMKWHAFLELAVQRFEIWWDTDSTLAVENQRSDELTVMLECGGELVHVDIGIHELTADLLPPLGETECNPNSLY